MGFSVCFMCEGREREEIGWESFFIAEDEDSIGCGCVDGWRGESLVRLRWQLARQAS
jgi:hypothetical protein